MSTVDSDREEFALLVRGLVGHLEWARQCGSLHFSREHDVPAPYVMEPWLDPPLEGPREPHSSPPSQRQEVPAEEPLRPADRAVEPRVSDASVASPRTLTAPVSAQTPSTKPVVATSVTLPIEVVSPMFFAELEERPELLAPVLSSANLSAEQRVRALSVLAEEVSACRKCQLCERRKQTVFSRGDSQAELFFVGEAPGADEDEQGVPFVGAAGQLLDKILAAMGMSDRDVYIANVAKCRPPNNRVPSLEESAACGAYLHRQLDIVRPKLVVALGKAAANFLLGRSSPMDQLRGIWHDLRGIPMMVTWHPSYLLRNPDAKKDTWQDMKVVLGRLGREPAPTTRT
ncbi:MAG: uracil-DNA glycosylase family protein [Deltaproteobacteria bacterium]|nr:uracil-DNA glycosylase family protein [Deltaproteobacteria bacterium]